MVDENIFTHMELACGEGGSINYETSKETHHTIMNMKFSRIHMLPIPFFSYQFTDRKTFKTPRRPYEKERLDAELKLVGEYGLRCKREIWRVQYALAKLRKAARTLLTLDPKDPKRIFEGAALLRRMSRYGLLADDELDLDSILQLTTQKLLERRLQTKVYKQGLAKSIHHARVLIRQRHIRVGNQLVNVPSFNVRTSSEKHIDFSTNSPYGQGPPGRVAKKRAASRAAAGDDEE